MRVFLSILVVHRSSDRAGLKLTAERINGFAMER